MDCRESQAAGFLADEVIDIRIVELRDAVAAATNQELTGVRTGRSRAANERVQRIETVHEIGFNKEFQRAVDGRRGRFLAVPVQRIEDIVSADRLVAVPDQFKHAAPDRGEAQPALAAQSLRRRERIGNAAPVIMCRGREWATERRPAHT